MCLIFVAWKQHPDYPLIVAANRDEYFSRPTAPAGFWEDAPGVLAGRDLRGGGTWLGVSRGGRFAAITNYRSADPLAEGAPTRGHLVTDFLLESAAPGAYLDDVEARSGEYNGFTLLVGDRNRLHFFSNRGGSATELGPGVYGVSNALLDTPWPKVERGKRAFAALLGGRRVEPEALLALLTDREVAEDGELPDTGIDMERERDLSPIFVDAGDYGTRSSTVVLRHADGHVAFYERSYERGTSPAETLTYTYPVEPDREAV